jgi:hypothetical protein
MLVLRESSPEKAKKGMSSLMGRLTDRGNSARGHKMAAIIQTVYNINSPLSMANLKSF